MKTMHIGGAVSVNVMLPFYVMARLFGGEGH